MTRPRVLLSWSAGKDSAWALHTLRLQDEYEVAGLLTTINIAARRVSISGVREELVDAQAAAAGLPITKVALPDPCPNDQYEAIMGQVIEEAAADGLAAVAFGDLFLDDVRAYRERQMSRTGLGALFPLWGKDTSTLAAEMAAGGLRARIACLDPTLLPVSFAGRDWHESLAEFPPGIDPCGERGEFHTFAHAGPMFQHDVPIAVGEIVERSGFVYADLTLEPGTGPHKP